MSISNLGQIKRLSFKPQQGQIQTRKTQNINPMDTSVFSTRQIQPLTSTGNAHSASSVLQTVSSKTENKSNNKEISYADIDFENLTNLTKSELDTIEGQLQEDISNPNLSIGLENSLRTKLKKVKQAQKDLATGQTGQKDETGEINNKDNKEAKTNKQGGNSPKAMMANSVGAGSSKLSGGIGIAAAIMATSVTNKTGKETNQATELMKSEQSRMDNQKSDNEKKNKVYEEKLEKLQQQQKKDIKLQQTEEKKIQEEQKKFEETNAQVESISQNGASFINSAKDENEANVKQNEMNTRIEAKTQSAQSQNTKISSSQKKVNQLVRNQKTNTRASINLHNQQSITNKRYTMSINTAAARVVSANTAAGTAAKTSDTAKTIGATTQMVGQAAISLGQALKSNPYTQAAGETMEKYGRVADATGKVTSTTSTIVNSFSAKTTASAGVTAGSTMNAHGSNVRLGNIQRRTMNNSTSFSKQVTASTKSAKQLNKTTQTLKSQIQQTVSNVRSEINNQTMQTIADVKAKQTSPIASKQNILGKIQQQKIGQGNLGASVGMAGAMMANRIEQNKNPDPITNNDDPMKKQLKKGV